MKRLILITLLAFGFATANAQFYRLRYDSVEVVSKFKLGTVTDGNSTDAILLRRDNGGVYKVAQSNFATTASLAGKANLNSPNNTFTNSNSFQGTVSFDLTPSIYAGGGVRFWNSGNTFSGVASAPTLTSNRNYSFPDANGTIALTSSLVFQRSSGNITPITSGDRLSITTSSGTTAITAVSSSGTGNALYAQAADYNAISAINTSSSYAPINVLNNGSGALASFSNGTLGEVATVNNNGTITAPLLGYTKRLTANGTGAATTISIPHGLTGITGTSSVVASANSSAAGGYNYVDVDATNVNFYYTVAPISGTNNLIYSVTIK